MKLFQIEEERGFKIYRILGIKFSRRIKRTKKVSELEKEIEMLRNILDCCIDITKIPPAKGKIRDIQVECTKLLIQFKKICENNNLKYWLDSGTLLGAVRHKGFVPWDDDIDICMLREDYDKILPILKKEFENSDFYIRERSKNNFQIRIINKDDEHIGLDIFPVDSYYASGISDREKEELSSKIRKAQKIFRKNLRSYSFDAETTSLLKKDMKKVQSDVVMAGRYSDCEKPALFFGIDYPHSYDMLVFDYDTVFPLEQIEFEGEIFNCPKDYDKYLTTFYGDYMRLPNKVLYE